MFNFCDSFDGHAATADLLTKWNSNTNPTAIAINPTGGRYGGGCAEMIGNQGANQFLYKLIRGVTPAVYRQSVGFAFKMSANPTANTTFLTTYCHDAFHWPLIVTTTGQIAMGSGNSVIGNTPVETSAGLTLGDGMWHWIESRWNLSVNPTTRGLWVDGVNVLTGGSLEGGKSILGVMLRAPHEAGAGKTIWIDDLVVYDDAAETNGLVSGTSEPIGDHRFIKCDITGAGVVAGFTPSTGSNYQNVDDAVADDDATYNSGFASGSRDLFVHSNLGITPTSITAAVVNMRARTVDGGTGSLKGSASSNATLGAGPARSPAGAYQMLQSPLFRNPDGSVAWTGATFDAAEFGYEVT